MTPRISVMAPSACAPRVGRRRRHLLGAALCPRLVFPLALALGFPEGPRLRQGAFNTRDISTPIGELDVAPAGRSAGRGWGGRAFVGAAGTGRMRGLGHWAAGERGGIELELRVLAIFRKGNGRGYRISLKLPPSGPAWVGWIWTPGDVPGRGAGFPVGWRRRSKVPGRA